jgi:hypothetical protein
LETERVVEQAEDMFLSAGKSICRWAGSGGAVKGRKSAFMGSKNE